MISGDFFKASNSTQEFDGQNEIVQLGKTEQSSLPFYNYGKISAQEAESKLVGFPVGTGLLRCSASSPGMTLSFIQQGRISHARVGMTINQEVIAYFGIKILLAPPFLAHSPYYHGRLSREQANDRLKGQPLGMGLLRKSNTENADILSFVRNGIEHMIIDKNIEFTIYQYGIQKLILAPHYIPQPKKYDRQFTLNLGRGISSCRLNAKSIFQGIFSEIIDLESHRLEINRLNNLSTLTSNSRLYLIGHCQAGVNFLEGENHEIFFAEDFVNIIATYAPLLREKSNKKLKVSVVACEGANDDFQGNKSFAYCLSQAFDRAGLSVSVVARVGLVNSEHTSNLEFRKLINSQYHQPAASKFIFETENGLTTVTPHFYS